MLKVLLIIFFLYVLMLLITDYFMFFWIAVLIAVVAFLMFLIWCEAKTNKKDKKKQGLSCRGTGDPSHCQEKERQIEGLNVKDKVRSFFRGLFLVIKTICLYVISFFVALVIVVFLPSTLTIQPDGVMKDGCAIFVVVVPLIICILFYRKQRRKLAQLVLAKEAEIQQSVPVSYGECETTKVAAPASKGTPSTDYYIVLDIETTGFSRTNNQIIEIAANKYQDGQLVSRFHTFVNPGVPVPLKITRLTGIRDADVAKAPMIRQVKPKFLDFINGTVLVGHNIKSFDIPFLQEKLGVELRNPVYDTLAMAKRAFPDLPTYKLSYLNEQLGLGGDIYHRAASDVEITNRLYQACKDPENQKQLLAKQLAGTLAAICDSASSPKLATKAETGLTGKTICFTGEISISRASAKKKAEDAGAIIKTSVSKKLDYLVVGIQDKRLVGETGMSTAQRKAAELIEEGNTRLKVIGEVEFLDLLKLID